MKQITMTTTRRFRTEPSHPSALIRSFGANPHKQHA
jgi:hypothetical protein